MVRIRSKKRKLKQNLTIFTSRLLRETKLEATNVAVLASYPTKVVVQLAAACDLPMRPALRSAPQPAEVGASIGLLSDATGGRTPKQPAEKPSQTQSSCWHVAA
jgi:hypothetical protein